MLRITLSFTSILLLMTSVTGCTSKQKSDVAGGGHLQDISSQQWAALSQKPIYFGHQSVGANIVKGIREILAGRSDIPFRIADANDKASAGLHEFSIGENGDPVSKLRSFAEIVERDDPPANAVLVMKFCYVDMKSDTDVPAMFSQYKAAVEGLRVRYPGRSIVHVTMPLTTVESSPEFLLRKLLGRSSRRVLNAKRNEFNRLLRAEYGSKDPVFDLAGYESLRADGSHASYTLNGDTMFAMAPEWTSDGGHLNEQGRRHVAEQFLVRLASLPSGVTMPAKR